MDNLVASLIGLLAQISPLLNNTSAIANVISTLEKIIPIIAQEFSDLVTPVKNIIAALSANPATSLDQLTALRELDAQVDSEFEAAVAAYESRDEGN